MLLMVVLVGVVVVLLVQGLLVRFVADELCGIVFTQIELLIDDIGSVVQEVLLRVRTLDLLLIQDVRSTPIDVRICRVSGSGGCTRCLVRLVLLMLLVLTMHCRVDTGKDGRGLIVQLLLTGLHIGDGSISGSRSPSNHSGGLVRPDDSGVIRDGFVMVLVDHVPRGVLGHIGH